MVTVTVDVDVDLEDFDTEDLLEELQGRNIEGLGAGLNGLFQEPRWEEWLRRLDPPQEVRDAFYQVTGRMLL